MSFPPREQTYLSTCPVCQKQIDVTALEPFTKLKCPFCGQMVRVRRKFDHFLLVRQIGEGGMSRVFEAEDETLGRRVALKILNRHFSRDATRVEQFRQEALITANVTHPHVIKLYSVGYDQGYFYIAMELVGGGSLEQRIRRDGAIKEKEALQIGREVAEGLRAAQQLGLIHRDVKPANILFTEGGTAKVVDFGLALFVERGPDASGEIWATPYYVAPEKVLDNREDYRSDIFSLGATLYHALTGKPPHKAETNSIQELRMIKCRRVALEDSGLRFAARTVHVINRMLAFRPQERCANYDEAVEELRLAEGLVGQSYRTRLTGRKTRVIGGIAAVALLMAFSFGWFTRSTGARKAAAINNIIEPSSADLAGDGFAVQAGRKTVTERFLTARETMLKEMKFAEAHDEFNRLIEKGGMRQPTLDWARFNAAICAIIINKKEAAQKHLTGIAEAGAESGGVASPEVARFFTDLGARMGKNLGIGTPLDTLGYATANEAILGYLIQGLAEWHYGDAMTGAAELEYFSAHLKDVKSESGAASLEWVPMYAVIAQRYQKDIATARALLGEAVPTTIAGCDKAIDELKKFRERLPAQAGLRVTLNDKESAIKRVRGRMRIEQQRQQMAQDRTLRQKELSQLGEITATVPSLVQGYDYSRAVEMLKDIHFDSPEVQASLEGQRYLYDQAQAFLTQLFSDITAKGYQGKVQRREGSVLEGKVTAADKEKITITLERGVLTLPLESVLPETLLHAAQFFASQITDSTDFYQRQERIAVFARVAGLHQFSATIAAQLMEENRDFRTRWMKVVQ